MKSHKLHFLKNCSISFVLLDPGGILKKKKKNILTLGNLIPYFSALSISAFDSLGVILFVELDSGHGAGVCQSY